MTIQPDVRDMLAAIDADPSADLLPTRRDDRAAVRRAVAICAAERRGLVHIAYVRPHLPADVAPHVIGAVMSALHTTGHLVHIPGRFEPNGDVRSGNASKPARVSRLVRPIEGVEL